MGCLKLYLHVQEVDPRKQTQDGKCIGNAYISACSPDVFDSTEAVMITN